MEKPLELISSVPVFDGSFCYYQVLEKGSDFYLLSFKDSFGRLLWSNSSVSFKYLHERSRHVVTLGNELKKHWQLLKKQRFFYFCQ